MSGTTQGRLVIGWTIGVAASTAGIFGSYYFDLPTAPAIICCLGVILYACIFLKNRNGKVTVGK